MGLLNMSWDDQYALRLQVEKLRLEMDDVLAAVFPLRYYSTGAKGTMTVPQYRQAVAESAEQLKAELRGLRLENEQLKKSRDAHEQIKEQLYKDLQLSRSLHAHVAQGLAEVQGMYDSAAKERDELKATVDRQNEKLRDQWWRSDLTSRQNEINELKQKYAEERAASGALRAEVAKLGKALEDKCFQLIKLQDSQREDREAFSRAIAAERDALCDAVANWTKRWHEKGKKK